MRLLILIAALLVVGGCAKTRMTYYEDPKFANVKYKSLVVLSEFRNLEDKMYMETVFCKYLVKYNVECKRGVDVFPPTRTLTSSEFVSAFQSSNAEGLIVINLTGAYTTDTWVPPITNTSGTVTTYGNTAYLNANTSTVGGYAVSKPTKKYEVYVVDGETGMKSIVASGTSKGNAAAKSAHLSKSLAATFVKYLHKNGAI